MLTNPPIAEVAGHLRLVVARTARRLRQEAGADLSPSMISALASVDRHGPLTPSELAAHERVQRPTITRVLARLDRSSLRAHHRERRGPHAAASPALAQGPVPRSPPRDARARRGRDARAR